MSTDTPAPAATTPAPSSTETAAAAAGGSKWNINNWHWEEKEFGPWAHARLSEMLKGTNIPVPAGNITITKANVTGDAYANVRKGKRILGYDLKVIFEWTGEIKDGDGNALATVSKGRAKIPSISEDQDPSDWDLQDVAVDGDSAGHERLRDVFRKDGKKAIFATISQFVAELKAHQ